MAAAMAVAARLTPIESPTIPRKSPKPHRPNPAVVLHVTVRASISVEGPTPPDEARTKVDATPIRYEINQVEGKKQGAAGITTAAPYVTGQWGRGITLSK